jgi:hypothetical protein
MGRKGLSTDPGKSPVVGIRLPRELRERAIELAGPEYGALSEFVREAVADAVDAAEREDEQ